jgi:hypothetical protein
MDLSGGVRRLGVTIVAMTALVGAGAGAASARPTIYYPPPASSAPLSLLGHVGNDTVTSTNWSGYAVSSTSKFTDVVGSWVEPTATCTASGASYAAFWDGIDGYTSGSVEQLGTDSDCLSAGHPNYYAWYEMYPAGSVELPTAQYPVKPGDTLTAQVAVTGFGLLYTLSLKSSEGWTYSTTKFRLFLARSSAEMVAESPEICEITCSIASLADFGTVQFSGVEAAAGGTVAPFDTFSASSGPHEIIGETKAGVVRAQPTALSSSAGGDAFSIAWAHS